MRTFDAPKLLHVARELRQRQTPAEDLLWALLRKKQLLGLKFRRQQQIGPFIVDFYCHAARLVIEVDGGIHSQPEQADRDDNRDVYLREKHLEVLRFSNLEIYEQPDEVLRRIAKASGYWDQSVPKRKPSSPSPGRA